MSADVTIGIIDILEGLPVVLRGFGVDGVSNPDTKSGTTFCRESMAFALLNPSACSIRRRLLGCGLCALVQYGLSWKNEERHSHTSIAAEDAVNHLTVEVTRRMCASFSGCRKTMEEESLSTSKSSRRSVNMSVT